MGTMVKDCPRISSAAHCSDGIELLTQLARQGLVWQDTTLSLCYDRPCSASVDGTVPRIPSVYGARGLPYAESCYGIAMVMNDMCHEWERCRRAGSIRSSPVQFRVSEEQIMLWEASSEGFLRNRASCKDNTQRLLHHMFQTFVNFFIFQLHRHCMTDTASVGVGLHIMASSPEMLDTGQQPSVDHVSTCMRHCETILHHFLSLRRAHYQASRAWTMLHIGLSSAFFLASLLKKGRGEFEEDHRGFRNKARYQLLRDLANELEKTLPHTIHPHNTDILKTLKEMIGMSP